MKKADLINRYFRIPEGPFPNKKYKIEEGFILTHFKVSWEESSPGYTYYTVDSVINYITSGKWVLIDNQLDYLLF